MGLFNLPSNLQSYVYKEKNKEKNFQFFYAWEPSLILSDYLK